MAFFFLLGVGEYTKPKYCKKNGETKRATRTVQFAVNNIGFFKKGKILPRASPLPKLLSADSCTMKITKKMVAWERQSTNMPPTEPSAQSKQQQEECTTSSLTKGKTLHLFVTTMITTPKHGARSPKQT